MSKFNSGDENESGDELLEELEDNPLFKALTEEDADGDADDKDGEEDEGDELEPKDGDSPEVLKTKLTAKNKIIRQREGAIKRMQKEMEELRKGGVQQGMTPEAIAAIVAATRADTGKDETDAEEAELAELKQKFEDDPSSIVELMFTREKALKNQLASIIDRRDRHFTSVLEKSKTPEAPKEVLRIVERLRAQPQFKGWEDDKLITVAQSFLPLAKATGQRPPASMRGGGTSLPLDADNGKVEKRFKSALDAMGYGDEEEQ